MLENRRDAGHSLVETLIATAVLSIIFIAFMSVWNDREELRAQNAAKGLAEKESEQVFATIKRDYSMQIPGNTQIIADGSGIEIVRISPKQSNPYINYRVQFRSECVAFPSAQADQAGQAGQADQAGHARVYDEGFRKSIYGTQNRCLAKLNCPSDHYPVVRIVTQGQAENYSPSTYPSIGKSILSGPIGMALCAEQLPDQIKLWAEIIVAKKRSNSYEAIVVNKPLMLPLKSASDLLIIPN